MTSTSEKPPLVIDAEQAGAIRRSLILGRAIALGSYVGLLFILVLLYAINPDSSLAMLVVQLLPLLIFIPGLRRNRHRTYSWLCFVVLIYFVAIIPMVMGRGLWSDWLITLLCTTLFCSAMMTSRWLQYWNYYQQQEQPKTHREPPAQ